MLQFAEYLSTRYDGHWQELWSEEWVGGCWMFPYSPIVFTYQWTSLPCDGDVTLSYSPPDHQWCLVWLVYNVLVLGSTEHTQDLRFDVWIRRFELTTTKLPKYFVISLSQKLNIKAPRKNFVYFLKMFPGFFWAYFCSPRVLYYFLIQGHFNLF